jgi:hypothetical protein
MKGVDPRVTKPLSVEVQHNKGEVS